MVGGDHVEHAFDQRVPQRLVVTRLADRRVDPHHTSEFAHVLGVEQHVLRAGFGGDIHTTCLGLTQQKERVGGAVVGNVHPRAGPFGQGQHPADGFDLGHCWPRVEVGQWVDAAGGLQLPLPARHDGRIFRMDHGAYAQRRQDLKAFEQSAVGGRGQVAEGVADKGLEAAHAAFKQLLQVGDGVVAQQAMNAVVHIGRLRRLELERQRF